MGNESDSLASARASLRAAVASIETSHVPRADPASRLPADRSWTIVDHHEHDGRHYVIAVGRPRDPPGLEVLAPRELQVVAAASVGQSTKAIGYDLGLRDSTVRVLLARSAKKLGAKKRSELIAIYRRHTQT